MNTHSKTSEIMTTGEVADLLGCTDRHVVNLCNRGQLPYTLTGTHRRIRREDAMRLLGRAAATHGGPMTDDQIRSLWLHQIIAAHVVSDPVKSLAVGRARAEEIVAGHFDGEQWVRQWIAIIDRGPEEVRRVMVSTDPIARELRANSPFSGLLTAKERMSVLKASHNTRLKGTVNR
jgi:excisionase family DNA binding protein